MAEPPSGTLHDQPPSGRRRDPRRVRLIGILVVAAAVVALVVQNSQRVSLRLWFVTGHVRLIWVIVVCLVVGAALGFVVGRRARGRRSRRRRGPVGD